MAVLRFRRDRDTEYNPLEIESDHKNGRHYSLGPCRRNPLGLHFCPRKKWMRNMLRHVLKYHIILYYLGQTNLHLRCSLHPIHKCTKKQRLYAVCCEKKNFCYSFIGLLHLLEFTQQFL